MELALDDFISKNKIGRRGGRGGGGGGRGAGGGSGGARRGGGGGGGGGMRSRDSPRQNFTRTGGIPSGKWSHDRFEGAAGGGRRSLGGGGAAQPSTTKLLISNLDWAVSDADINELFGEFGGLRRAGIHYDASGRSLGTADVVFERRGDALRAHKQYDNVPLDGRPMKIEIVGGGGGPSATTSAVAKARQAAQQRTPRASGGGGGGRGSGGGRGGRGGGGRGGRAKEPTKTLEDLDKELDAYVNKSE